MGGRSCKGGGGLGGWRCGWALCIDGRSLASAGHSRSAAHPLHHRIDPCSTPHARASQGQTELLKGQIVQSPQKIQALLGELAGAVERERAMVADAGAGWERAGAERRASEGCASESLQ